MPRNGSLAEFVTEEGVTFQVVVEQSSNHKSPRHPARLDRYDGSQWHEVDRWDIEIDTERKKIQTYEDSEIVDQAEERINTKQRFDKDGSVSEVNLNY